MSRSPLPQSSPMTLATRSGPRQLASSLSESSSELTADNVSRNEVDDNSDDVGSQPNKSDAQRAGQNTDDSDSGRNGAGSSNLRLRQRRRAQGSATSASDQARTDAEDSERLAGGGKKGGSTLHIPCKFFKHGNCTAGNSCYFSHDINLFVEKTVCKYFVKGNCRYGNKCALMHMGPDGTPSRNQKTNGGGQRNQQGRSNHSNNSTAKGNIRNGPNSGSTPKKDRKNGGEPSYSDAAAGRALNSTAASALSQAYGQPGASNARAQSTASAVSGSSAHEDTASGVNSSDNGASDKKPTNAWATGSVAGAMRRDRESRFSSMAAQKDRRRFADSAARHQLADGSGETPDYLLAGDQHTAGTLSPLRAHYENARGNAAVEAEMNSRSQPIPKPSSSYNRAFRGNSSLPYGGLSMQDSMLIDNLTLTHGTAHQSFASSPFMTSSIPLLDHFKELARGEPVSTGTSPHAQSFTRSPMAASSGFMLNRHAFTAVDSGSLTQDIGDGDISTPGSLRLGYHGHLQSQHLEMSPAIHPVGGAQSIPLGNELFGRSLRSSSLANEPLSPLPSFVDGGAQSGLLGSPASASGAGPGSGRLRSNSNTLSPSLAGFSSGMEIGSIAIGSARASARDTGSLLTGETRLAGYSLNDARSIPHDAALESGNSIWEAQTAAYPGIGSAHDADARFALGSSLSSKTPGLQSGGLGSYFQQGSSQPHWAHQPAKMPMQQNGHSSPFASAIGSLNDHRSMAGPHLGFGSPAGEGALPGAIGPRSQKPQGGAFGAAPGAPRSYPHSGGLAASFGGIGSSMFALEAGRAQNASGNGSSATSDNIDDLFELEQDVPAQSRANSNNSLAPNPSFISMDGFSHKFSGLSLNRSEAGSGSPNQSGSRSIPGISAIARPAA